MGSYSDFMGFYILHGKQDVSLVNFEYNIQKTIETHHVCCDLMGFDSDLMGYHHLE